MDLQLSLVFLFGFAIGSGAALKRAGPFIFFYICAPILSAIGMVLVLEQVEIPGIDFEFDALMPMVISNQEALIVMVGKGLIAGLVVQWLIKTLFLKKNRRVAEEFAQIDGKTPMSRRKYLAVLGLTPSAGPRDILMAWTKLSAEARSSDWNQMPRRRKTDIGPEERLKQINEAYEWLKANPRKNGIIRRH